MSNKAKAKKVSIPTGKPSGKQAVAKAAEKVAKVKVVETGTCLCSCGTPTKARRKFAMGHDARLKGYLIRALQAKPRPGDPSLSTLISTAQQNHVTVKLGATPVDLATAINPLWIAFMRERPVKEKAVKAAKPAAPAPTATEKKKAVMRVVQGAQNGKVKPAEKLMGAKARRAVPLGQVSAD